MRSIQGVSENMQLLETSKNEYEEISIRNIKGNIILAWNKVKRAVNVISNNSPCMDGNARFTTVTVPVIALSSNCLFSFADFLQKWLAQFLHKKKNKEIYKVNLLNLENRRYHPNFWSNNGNDTVVNLCMDDHLKLRLQFL